MMLQGARDKGKGARVFFRYPCPLSRSPCPFHGFSLVEVVVSLAILSVGLLAAMRVFPVGLRASQRSERSSRAVMAAQRTIESLKLKPWSELVDGATSVTDGPYTITVRVAAPAVEELSDPSRLKAVDVVVAWEEDGRPRRAVFVTQLVQPT